MVNEEKEWNCRKFLFLWRGEFHENSGKNSRKEKNNQDWMVSLCVEEKYKIEKGHGSEENREWKRKIRRWVKMVE